MRRERAMQSNQSKDLHKIALFTKPSFYDTCKLFFLCQFHPCKHMSAISCVPEVIVNQIT